MTNKSSELHIFPCSNRKVNQGDNYVTQKNLTNIIKHLPASGNYIVSTTVDANPFCFFIEGYYVEISGGLRAFAGIESDAIYASVSISDGYLSGSDSSDDLTTSTQDFIKFNNESGDLLLVDENDYVPTLPISGNSSLLLQNKSINSSAKIELKHSGTDERPEVLVRSGAGDSGKPGLTYISAYNAGDTAKSQLTLSGSGNGEIILYTNNSNGVINIGTNSIKPTVNINSTSTNISSNVIVLNASKMSSSYALIQLDTDDNTGFINIGTSTSKPTVNINSTRTNISSASTIQLDTKDNTGIINIGTSNTKPTVNINSTTTNISGAVRIGNANDRRILTAYTTTTTIRGNIVQLRGNNNATINLKQSGEIDVGESDSAQAVKINLNAPTHVKNTLTTGNIVAVEDSLYDIGDSNHKYNNAYIDNLYNNNIYGKVFYENNILKHLVQTYSDISITISAVEGTSTATNVSFSGFDIGELSVRFLHLKTDRQSGQTKKWAYTSPSFSGYSVYSHNIKNVEGLDDVEFSSASSIEGNKLLLQVYKITGSDTGTRDVEFDLILYKVSSSSSTTSETSTSDDSTGGGGGGMTPETK